MAAETDTPATSPPATGLADRLQHATARLHREAERSGFIGDLLSRRGTLPRYVVFLRNLLPVYEALEAGLQQQAVSAAPLAALASPALYRSAALRADLDGLAGPDWMSTLTLLDAGAAYATQVEAAARLDNGATLAAHAYVRYLGDLNGGQILARLLSRNLGIADANLATYAFPQIADVHTFAASYRRAIDDLARVPHLDLDAIEAEAIASFRCAIALANAVSATL